jgi:predicted dehydrogenase
VVGTGALGTVHARVLSKLTDADLVGVHDTDADRARNVGEKWKVPVLEDLDAVAEHAEAAIVAVPTSAHLKVAERLLDAGVHCLIEKPLASTTEEARRIVALARERNCRLMVGHVERFNPAVVAILEQGLAPRFLEAHRVSPFPFRSADVGVVLDMMIHDIDLILHLVRSKVTTVHAVGVGVLGDTEDMANARLVFENGAVANVTASRIALKTERKLRFFAEDTYVTLDFHKKSGRLVRLAPGVRENIADGRIKLEGMTPLEATVKRLVRSRSLKVRAKDEPLMLEDQEFLDAVNEGRDPAVTGEHGVLAMETAARVVASIRETAEV